MTLRDRQHSERAMVLKQLILGHVVCCGVLADKMHLHLVNYSLIAPLHEHFVLKIKALGEFSISAIQNVA